MSASRRACSYLEKPFCPWFLLIAVCPLRGALADIAKPSCVFVKGIPNLSPWVLVDPIHSISYSTALDATHTSLDQSTRGQPHLAQHTTSTPSPPTFSDIEAVVPTMPRKNPPSKESGRNVYNGSFKRPSSECPRHMRSPSPPRAFIEPLSPIRPRPTRPQPQQRLQLSVPGSRVTTVVRNASVVAEPDDEEEGYSQPAHKKQRLSLNPGPRPSTLDGNKAAQPQEIFDP